MKSWHENKEKDEENNLSLEKLKWLAAWKKSHKTDKNAMCFTKYFLRKRGYRYLSFESRKGYPRDGVVDLIAAKIDRKDHDKIKIFLFQIKGGRAKVSDSERKRLKNAVKKVKVCWNIAEKPENKVIIEKENEI